MAMSLYKAGGIGAAAGFFLPSLLGGGSILGSGGANATPAGSAISSTISLLPYLLLAGGALYAVQVLKK